MTLIGILDFEKGTKLEYSDPNWNSWGWKALIGISPKIIPSKNQAHHIWGSMPSVSPCSPVRLHDAACMLQIASMQLACCRSHQRDPSESMHQLCLPVAGVAGRAVPAAPNFGLSQAQQLFY